MRRSRVVLRCRGFSLLEILVATSMLAVAMAALSQLAAVGRSHLSAATQKSVATHLASNQLARLAAGIEPLAEIPGEPLAEDPRWEVRVTVLPLAAAAGLVEVEVGVRQAEEASEPDGNESRWYTLAQWMRP